MSGFHVERSIQIAASPEQVFDSVADFRTWSTWSPWLIADPDAQVTISPKADEVGATYAWQGEVVGAGEIEHQRLDRPRRIEDQLRFLKPFPSRSRVVFEIQPVGDQSQLTWHMWGSLPWFMFWMRSMMQTFIGMDYARGLKMLKEWIETGRIQSQVHIKGNVTVEPLHMLGVRGTCAVVDVGPAVAAACQQAAQRLRQLDLPTNGGMITVYHRFDTKRGAFDCTAGFVVPESSLARAEGLAAWSHPAGQALCVEHTGSYEHLGNAWSVANSIARYRKLKLCRKATFELYKTTPPETPTSELRTEIYLPLRR